MKRIWLAAMAVVGVCLLVATVVVQRRAAASSDALAGVNAAHAEFSEAFVGATPQEAVAANKKTISNFAPRIGEASGGADSEACCGSAPPPATHVAQPVAAPRAEMAMKRSPNATTPLGALHGGAALGSAGMAATGRGGGVGYLAASPALQARGGPSSPVAAADRQSTSEDYKNYGVNPVVETAKDHLSTFSVDVDTAAYTVARRKILEGSLPPMDAIRVEEFMNYFHYDYPEPKAGDVFSVTMDAAPSPYTRGKHVLRVGLQARHLSASERKPAHLTFLVDVSGSMQSPDKLPLAKRALRMLVDNLHDGDVVSMVTYAGGVKVALPPTPMEKKAQIHSAIEDLNAEGSTSMAGGIELAYKLAHRTLDSKSNSRVIILSDGDANVGATSHEEILKMVAGYTKEGITVTTLGFGMGNYKDTLMEQFANKGNGNHYYIDSLAEAHRVLVKEMGSTLDVVAQDVKLQVDFDPDQVKSYRLIGYENRDIRDVDFRNDKVDAGEIGAGHRVTALYEVELRPGAGDKLATVRVRAKAPRGVNATERAYPFSKSSLAETFASAHRDLRFATAAMGAAEIFRQSPFAKRWNYTEVVQMAKAASNVTEADRQEFIELLNKANRIVSSVALRD